MIDLATNTYTHFGTAHIVCNNAGVGGGGGLIWEIPQSGWDWTFGVNFWGVLNGIRAFTPAADRAAGRSHHQHRVGRRAQGAAVHEPVHRDEARGRRHLGGAGDRAAHDRIAGEGLGAVPRASSAPASTSPSATGPTRSATRPRIEQGAGRRDGARPDRGRHGPGRPRASASSPRCAPSSSSSSATTRTPRSRPTARRRRGPAPSPASPTSTASDASYGRPAPGTSTGIGLDRAAHRRRSRRDRSRPRRR